jgi:hypothetical protein
MQTVTTIEKKIVNIKKQLLNLGDMHPGSLTKQFNICGNPKCKCKDPENPQKHGPYYNLSFVLRGKSTSRFIKGEHVSEIKRQLANYKKFKELVEEWKTSAAELAKLKIDAIKRDGVKKSVGKTASK